MGEQIKLGNCEICGNPMDDDKHDRVNERRDHEFTPIDPAPQKLEVVEPHYESKFSNGLTNTMHGQVLKEDL